MLVNGVRVSGFAEIRDLPTEAIMRTDILAEEVALKYGYRADQRVVNLVLRPRFRAWTGEVNARSTAEGGRDGLDAASTGYASSAMSVCNSISNCAMTSRCSRASDGSRVMTVRLEVMRPSVACCPRSRAGRPTRLG